MQSVPTPPVIVHHITVSVPLHWTLGRPLFPSRLVGRLPQAAILFLRMRLLHVRQPEIHDSLDCSRLEVGASRVAGGVRRLLWYRKVIRSIRTSRTGGVGKEALGGLAFFRVHTGSLPGGEIVPHRFKAMPDYSVSRGNCMDARFIG